ncbi:hypothetical protein MT325_M032L [Paramecium bursaria chlorella virus MT325]|uniref:Uncharacterized protein M032L n=1 Tax=Paramecium bursaria Chlorella virus MT325 TaxID=346932 RepID=A7ITB2_PBCVM|nr:hypothetical protein MT325_M032L [Paramecium bursaria chlorella virus MT325]
MGFIYKLTLKKESRKAYIGQTIRDIHKRLEEHQLESSNCRAILAAIQKHGWDNFDKEWYEVPDEDLNFYEEMLVALLGTLAPGGYNLKEGGGNGKHSKETKQKMSKSKSGEKHPMYGKTGEKNPMYGKEHTEEAKKKMREALTGEKHPMYGKEHTDETKKKMREATSGEKNHNSKRVYQYTLDGTYVDEYGSSGEAARALGKTNGSPISSCACGDRKKAYGFKWSRKKL